MTYNLKSLLLIIRGSVLANFIFSFIIVLFVYHLVTLQISPLPWFDETFFASITSTYSASGTYALRIAPFAYNNELLLYGPLYFWITSWLTNVFEFSIFSFRLSGVLFGFLDLFVLYKIIRLYIERNFCYIIILAIALDPLLNSSMNSGRMECVALFFVLLAIYVYLKAIIDATGSSRKFLLIIVSGLTFSAALLTTPRVGIILLALCLTQLFYLFKRFSYQILLQLMVFGVVLTSIYYLWILYAFGSIENLLSYYAEFKEYIGSSWFHIPVQQIPLAVITLISIFLGAYLDHKRFFTRLVFISFLAILLFYISVHDTGTYSTLIIPFQYVIIGSSFYLAYKKLPLKKRPLFKIAFLAPIFLILSFNSLFFSLKALTIYITYETRNPKYIDDFVKSNIPPGSKVIGDDLYFYAVHHSKSDFQFISHFKSDLEREYYHRKIYDYDYILWSEQLANDAPQILKTYQNNSKLIKIAEFKFNQNKNFPFINTIQFLSKIPIERSYNCILFKRLN